MSLAKGNLSKKLASQTMGHWLPRDKSIILRWVEYKVKQAKERKDDVKDSVQAFSDFVTGNPTLNTLANQMFSEVPANYHGGTDPTGHPSIPDFQTFIATLNTILVTGPEFYEVSDPDAMGLIGFPINAVLDWPMGTKSGWAFWYDPEVNLQFAPVLQDFTNFLGSTDSKAVLAAPNGWVGQQAQQLLATKGNDGETDYSFTQLYDCPDPTDNVYLGFQSWDEFFTREFNTNMRPPAEPLNNSILNNSCESAPLQYMTNVKEQDNFFLKGQPYSLMNMLNFNKTYVNQFVGGSVYQAFLSALSYHRWNSPVNGKVVDFFNVPGTYYSENIYQGFPNPDPNAPNNSQPYISSVATRGIIYIQAEEPIGLMAIVYIGMAEVSSCEFTVTQNQYVQKGDELGMFHFGGSSHCMVFRPGLNLVFNNPPGPPVNNMWPDEEYNLPVNSALALVTSSSSR